MTDLGVQSSAYTGRCPSPNLQLKRVKEMGNAQTIEQRQPVVNGIDVKDVKALIETIKQDARTGLTRWSVTSAWQGRTHIRAEIGPVYFGEKAVKRPFAIDIDEPAELGGGNAYPNPQEHLIAALNACMMVGYVSLCALQGIALKKLRDSDGRRYRSSGIPWLGRLHTGRL